MKRRRGSQSSEEQEDQGSVWTSYSDLFTTVAIIFLVMFIIALLRTGMKSIQALKDKQEQKKMMLGDVPAKLQSANQQKKDELKQSIKEMKQYDEIISKKVVEMNSFSQKMKQHKKVMEKLLEDQERKQVAIQNLKNLLKHKKGQIKDTDKKLKQAKREFKKSNQLLQKRYDTQSKEVQQKNDQIARLQKEIEAKEIKLSESVKKFREFKQSSEQQVQNTSQMHQNRVAKLNEKLHQLNKINQGQQREIKQSEAQAQKASKQLTQTQNDLAKIKQHNQNLKQQGTSSQNEVGELKQSLNSLNSEVAKLQQQNQALSAKYNQAMSDKDKIVQKNSQHRSKVAKLTKGISTAHKRLRAQLAKKLADRFLAADLNVKVDPVTGDLTLKMGDSFLFERNSFILLEKAKVTLQKIIPIYAEVLFNDPSVAKRILGVNIVGHASPRYKRQFVDPWGENNKAYQYNLELSSNRSKAIVKFIFGTQFQDFNYKIDLRSKISAIGRSFSLPIKSPGRSLASVDKSDCGAFDCEKSRRVEISFTLKDDHKAWKKLLELQQE